jgi:hypothetical protein
VVVRRIPRIQEVVLPILKAELPGVQVVSWVPDVADRQYPIVNIRRLGGLEVDVDMYDRAVIELTVFTDTNLIDCENLCLDARQVLWDAWKKQTVVPGKGSIGSFNTTLGPTQFDSPYDDTWRVQTLIQLGLRPTRF